MNNKEEIKYFIKTKGYNLGKIGIKSFGFLRKDALKLIELLFLDNILISGGDVLFMDKNGYIELTYDNWYCEKEDNETDEQYAKKSIILTRDYISKYKNDSVINGSFLFDIVFNRKLLPDLFTAV